MLHWNIDCKSHRHSARTRWHLCIRIVTRCKSIVMLRHVSWSRKFLIRHSWPHARRRKSCLRHRRLYRITHRRWRYMYRNFRNNISHYLRRWCMCRRSRCYCLAQGNRPCRRRRLWRSRYLDWSEWSSLRCPRRWCNFWLRRHIRCLCCPPLLFLGFCNQGSHLLHCFIIEMRAGTP